MGDAILEAEETQADFLFLRQLGQDASSVRISDPLNLENSETSVNLICISNMNGLLFAATNEGFIAHQLKEVRRLCSSSSRKESPRLETPSVRISTTQNTQLEAKVIFLRIADQEQRLIVGLANGRIAIWLISDLMQNRVEKVIIMQPPSANYSLLELAPNPSDRPELCIALYGSSNRHQFQCGTAVCFDVRSGRWGSELKPASGSMTTSLCWSVKGKQVVLGLQDGTLAQMTPEGEPKDVISKAQGLSGSPYVEQVVWLENHVFLVTYNQPPSSEEPEHQYEVYSILRDLPSKSFKYIHFTDPAPPFGDTSKRGHRFTSWIKNWEPTKHMLFLANTSSTDVGLLGCLSGAAGSASWRNLDLEDTSRPVLPFSSLDSSADTSPVGLDLDCTAENNVDDPQAANRGEDGKGKLSPMPVLYIYTTDGLLLAYTIINVDTKAGKYSGMVKGDVGTMGNVAAEEVAMSTDGNSQVAPVASSFASPSPSFGASTGLSGMGSTTPAFGQSASIGANTTSPFSFNPSASNNAATFTLTSSANTGGFGAFAPKPANGFGNLSPSSSFKSDSASSNVAAAFGTSSAPPSVFASSNAPTAPTSAFGQISIPSFGSSSAFGQSSNTAFGASSAFGQTSAPAFGSSSSFGQASAFGAAANNKSPFATASSISPMCNAFSTSKPLISAGFGGFASKDTTSFNATSNSSNTPGSIFGSGGNLQGSESKNNAPIFGQSTFAKASAFAKPAPSAMKESTNLDMDEGGEGGGGDAGSLSFGGLSGLLGDDKSDNASDAKNAGFNVGSKQDATFSSMPSPAPFSFSQNTTTPKKDETKAFAFANGMPPISTPYESTSSVKSVFASTTPSASPAKESIDSTTPSSSPLKTEATVQKSAFAHLSRTASSPRSGLDANDDVSGDEEEETVGEQTGDLENADAVEEDWEEEEDDYEDDDGEEEVAEGEEEEEEEEEDDEEEEEEEEEEDDEEEEEEEDEEEEEIRDEESEIKDDEEQIIKGDIGEDAERDDLAEERGNTAKAEKEAVEEVKSINKEVKMEKKSPTSFNFFPSSQAKTSAASEPPTLTLEPTAVASSTLTTTSNTNGPQPWPLANPDTSTVPQNTAKSQPFYNFSNRAPRSSSPLSGIPVNRADLPPSPDKANLNRAATNPAALASKALPVQGSPAIVTPVQQQRTSLSTETTPKFSFSSTKPEPKVIEGEGLQGIFLQTFLTMERELKVLTENVKRCSEFQEVVREPNAIALGLFDLSDETKWTFGELETKSKLTKELMIKAEELSQETRVSNVRLKDIQSQHLKVDVKREEIARFVRARNDPSFSKMIRIKQLGPEHADNQIKLRKATMSLREGIDELEAFLEKMKRITLEQRAGDIGALRAPSLDTIRRTARNITQMAQLRLMELQELELIFDQMMQKRTISMRSTFGKSAGKEQDALDTMNNIKGALPLADGSGKSLFSATMARELQKKHLDLKSVFKSGWKEPVLTRVTKRKENTADDFRLSDLDMAFARGTVRINEKKAPVMADSTNGSSVDSTFKPASATTGTLAISTSFASNTVKPPLAFNPLPSSALNKDAFQLPPEQAPFSPGGSSPASAAGRAHISKYGGKRNTAVALPSTSTSSANSSGSDFFAMPSKFASTSPIKATSSILPGGPSFSFANGSTPLASLSSRLGPSLTFKGIQPMQPIAQSSNLTSTQLGCNDDDNSDSKDDQAAFQEDQEGEDIDEYEDEGEDGGEEENDEGLSDVVEGEEE